MILSLALAWGATVAVGAGGGDERARLAAALERGDLAAVRSAVEEGRRELGERAGVPETEDVYQPIPTNAAWLTAEEARAGFAPYLRKMAERKWWTPGLDPTQLHHALRETASVVSGCACAARAGLEGGGRGLELAREAADFMLWAQARAGSGGFPFPAVRGYTNDKAFLASDRYLRRMEEGGRLERLVHNGWMIDDPGEGGLQFDNAEAGAALFEFHDVTKDPRYRDAAVKAADWAMARPLVPNWNYNSFSVYLLARACAGTGEGKYRAAALKKAKLGVLPGQLPDGPRAGRWLDPHNAKPVYHYILLRSLVQLAAVLPRDDPDRPEIVRALRLGLLARNRDFLERGAPNRDKAMETLLLAGRVFADDRAFLRETLSDEALDRLGRLVSSDARAGRLSLAPREWAMFLAEILRRAGEERQNHGAG